MTGAEGLFYCFAANLLPLRDVEEVMNRLDATNR